METEQHIHAVHGSGLRHREGPARPLFGGLEDQEVTVGIRPEGFILDENGPLTCHLNNVEVMGRDVSVVSTHPASLKPSVRSIIDADDRSGLKGETVRYSVKPHKLFVFHKETEQRLAFEVK